MFVFSYTCDVNTHRKHTIYVKFQLHYACASIHALERNKNEAINFQCPNHWLTISLLKFMEDHTTYILFCTPIHVHHVKSSATGTLCAVHILCEVSAALCNVHILCGV